MNVLVTGASGFVGGAVTRRLVQDGMAVRAALRRPVPNLPREVDAAFVGDLDAATAWSAALEGMDVVVHASARVHVMRESAVDPLAEFRRVNVEGTLALARAAVEAGVKRFVFISSIKVNGEGTLLGRPFTAADAPNPGDPYGISKLEAERALLSLAKETNLEVVIIRPVLVYGPGVKGNFLSMMRWVTKGIPLPFGAVQNRRSLVALDNLVDLIAVCVRHPAAPGHVFLVSDGEDLSTPALLRLTAKGLRRSARLVPIPAGLIRAAASLVGMAGVADRLCGSLQVDITETRARLDWHPPFTAEESLARTARHYLEGVGQASDAA